MPPEFGHFANPLAQWQVLPSFMLGELLFITGALLALWHALRTGRENVLIWVAALVAGTANDFIFMALPLVDNFWQAQGTIMLTPRMPLYIPCVYVCFMYLPTAAVRRWRLPRTQTVALSGLMGSLFYAPYDIVGAKFLWWTWHDTDLPIAERLFGAPCSSSLWVLTFGGAFALLVDVTLRKRTAVGSPPLGAGVFAAGFALVAAFTTALMMVQMTALQMLDGGTPGRLALAIGAALYAAAAAPALRRARPVNPSAQDRIIARFCAAHLAALALIGLLFSPESHVSRGLHQPIGECYVEQTDITGLKRFEFLCVSDFDEDYTFDCLDGAPPEAATWYTVCGRAHVDRVGWTAGLLALCAAAAFAMTTLYGGLRKPR